MACFLDIISSPSGADVTISLKSIGKTPIDDYKLYEGKYNIEISKAGYISKTFLNYEIKKTDLAKTLGVTLEKMPEKPAYIKITSSPSKARIFLDGKNTGYKTTDTLRVDEGKHTIKLTLEDYEDYEKSVIAIGNKTINIDADLKKIIPEIIILGAPEMTEPHWASIKEQLEKSKELPLPLRVLASPKTTLILGAVLAGLLTYNYFFLKPIAEQATAVITAEAASKGTAGYANVLVGISKGATEPQMIALTGKLITTSAGREAVRGMISQGAIKGFLAESVVTAMQKVTVSEILASRGIMALLTPKTIAWAVAGIAGILGAAYSISFGTSWMAKEGIKEQFEIPLSDRMRDYRREPTKELLAIIQTDMAKLEEALPIAEKSIRAVSWLWPFTKSMWDLYADNLYFELNQYKEELKLLVPSELVKIPEVVRVYVRDIVDGDTIETDLKAIDDATGNTINLPEVNEKGHASIRLVGINAPEKSPKGEILCTGIEVYKVEKSWSDESRNVLLYLNDKQIKLYIDPEKTTDSYGRILAKVEYAGKDINLEQIKKGLACWYFREKNKYVNDDVYKSATLSAMNSKIGMWSDLPIQPEIPEEVPGVEEKPTIPVAPPVTKILFSINSAPERAKVWIDDIYTNHTTPTDEVEQKKELYLWTEGKHKIRLIKGGYSAEQEITLIPGERLTLNLELKGMITAPVKVPEVPVVPVVPVVPGVPPTEEKIKITDEELFFEMKRFYVGRMYMSKKELASLLGMFDISEIQQFIDEINSYYVGRAYLSKKEMIELGIKHNFDISGL